ncbi:hypothetical protein GCM10010124_23090 [Pilimelia terevasa]|uniref:Mycothiol-dependent maleylpyruvate isomerase metal-binding domain-containing protein n=1 Tax=Pilimelia terevasa TaxID=53372 RepID=A0A8J3BKW9_9ACTN|nr:maleylpyruvate isomerase family mycothiol-dependent enzyme [Pilimelia terevasa]GGK29749.1 hypothetical protein GCM10010124_23090 [Pilimelia terevasa]
MHRVIGGRDFWLGALRQEGAAFDGAVAQARADAPVPSCPGWTVESLTAHLGGAYSWIRGHVDRGVIAAPEPVAAHAVEIPPWPRTAQWCAERHDLLLATLEHLDPGMPAWNWAPQTKTAAFWFRRAAHEAAVHRWDAQAAVGTPTPIEAKLAADGVTEVLDTWLPAGRRFAPQPRTGVVRLSATDLETEWYVRLRDENVALLDTDTLLDDDEAHHETAHAVGTASDLQLALWGRIPFDALARAGDPALLTALRTG